MERDPIPFYRNRLIEFGFDEARVDGIDAEVLAEVDAATETAKTSPEPSVDIVLKEMWADGGSAWRN